MTTFVAIYHGPTVSTAKLVALSADPDMVEDFVAKLLPGRPSSALATTRTQSLNPREDANPQSNGVVDED